MLCGLAVQCRIFQRFIRPGFTPRRSAATLQRCQLLLCCQSKTMSGALTLRRARDLVERLEIARDHSVVADFAVAVVVRDGHIDRFFVDIQTPAQVREKVRGEVLRKLASDPSANDTSRFPAIPRSEVHDRADLNLGSIARDLGIAREQVATSSHCGLLCT
jgi:hypothetical protein